MPKIKLCNGTKYRVLLLVITAFLGLAGCADHFRMPVPDARYPIITSGYFALPHGIRLPYRRWLPDAAPKVVVLALHGFNDSRDAWDLSAPAFTRAGIAIFAPDQAGFGLAPRRGFWPGSNILIADARQMIAILHRRHPRARLIVLGESMGDATALLLGAARDPLVDGYIIGENHTALSFTLPSRTFPFGTVEAFKGQLHVRFGP